MSDIGPVLAALSQSGIPIGGLCRFDPDLLLPNLRSASRLPKRPKTVIVGLFPYFTVQSGGGNLSIYSAIPDYHLVAGGMLDDACKRLKLLFPEGEFIPFVDASPIDEVTAALRSGLGLRGKNGQLITKEYGSLVFIGEIVSDLELGAVSLEEKGCEGCGACLAACPTGALQNGGFDKSVCRSFFSQKKGELTDWERRQLISGGLVWGCDICTLACPHNRPPKATPITGFLCDVEPRLDGQNLERLMKNRAFAWRGEGVLRRNLSLLGEAADGRPPK